MPGSGYGAADHQVYGSHATNGSITKPPLSPASSRTVFSDTQEYVASQRSPDQKRYKPPTRSFSSPRVPSADLFGWDSTRSHAPSQYQIRKAYHGPRGERDDVDPLGMNKI